ncbi:MAG: 1-(5-phosphoribosyl)-5-[(5-phosphoribosylamino)methylideneamino] imidazole-4-carboxamide isomerase [Gemmatimonadota bacterium]|nr:1-(5-phosphoribosyl)-5-[(5-phosphoribosylamino)methylideneamino] imidazole-4-carboxamide isomerase [Gemmatimonadota bacterium]
MIAIPAIDLREGACVQLVGGEYDAERVRLDDPIAVAREWLRVGFHRLHVVDLDAATKRGNNADLIRELLREIPASIQVGGGVRDLDAIERLFDEGAYRVTIGTRAIEDRDWLSEATTAFPGQIIVAADVRERRVVRHGWSRMLPRDIVDVAEELSGYPLGALLVTAVELDERIMPTDLSMLEDVVEASSHAVFSSGGITLPVDLRALAERGVSAAIIGVSLYTGALDPRQIAEEFAE